jgi:hypothetical protein
LYGVIDKKDCCFYSSSSPLQPWLLSGPHPGVFPSEEEVLDDGKDLLGITRNHHYYYYFFYNTRQQNKQNNKAKQTKQDNISYQLLLVREIVIMIINMHNNRYEQ